MAAAVQTRHWTAGIGAMRLWAIVKAVAPTTLVLLSLRPPIGYFAVMLPAAVTGLAVALFDLGSDSGGPAWAVAAAIGAIAAGVCAMIAPRRAPTYRLLDGLSE